MGGGWDELAQAFMANVGLNGEGEDHEGIQLHHVVLEDEIVFRD